MSYMAFTKKLKGNLLINGKRLKAFSLKSRTKPGCQLSLFLFNIFLHLKKNKWSLIIDNMIVYIKKSEN